MALLFALLLFTGCWDKTELEDYTFVIMLGLDKADGDNLLVSLAYPVTQTNIGDAEGQGEYAVISAKSPTIAEAISLFGLTLAGPISLFSTKTLVVSEELARDEMLSRVFSSGQYEQMRNNTNVLVSSGSAAEFIAARIEKPAIDPLRQEDLLLEQANFSAYYRPMQLLDFIINLRPGGMDAATMYGGLAGGGEEKEESKDSDEDRQTDDPVRTVGYLPGQAPISGDNPVQIGGLAVFSGRRMVGALTSAETRTLSMLTHSRTQKTLSIPSPYSEDEEMIVTVMPTRKGRTRANIDENGRPSFDITVHLRARTPGTGVQTMDGGDEIARQIEAQLTQKMERLIKKLQDDYRVDLLGLGGRLSRNFYTIQEWEAYGWESWYPQAEIRVEVKVELEGGRG